MFCRRPRPGQAPPAQFNPYVGAKEMFRERRPVHRVGPVVVNLAAGVTANASIGTAGHTEWLERSLAAGGLTLNGGASLDGFVAAGSP